MFYYYYVKLSTTAIPYSVNSSSSPNPVSKTLFSDKNTINVRFKANLMGMFQDWFTSD